MTGSWGLKAFLELLLLPQIDTEAERAAKAWKPVVEKEFCLPKAVQARKDANALQSMVNVFQKFRSPTVVLDHVQARHGPEEEWAGYSLAVIWFSVLKRLENDIRSAADSQAPDDEPTPAILFLYLFGYVDRGSTKTYNSGALEFRDIYVSVLLFQGSYVWIKFRDVSTKRTSFLRKDGKETVRYEGRCKLPGGKKYLHAGTYENREDAKVGGRIAEFYSGTNTEGKVDLQDGFSFDIPPVLEAERLKLSEVSSFSDEQASKYKRNWIKDKTQEVFKMYKEQRARWIESFISDLIVTPPVQESMNQQPNVQEGQPGGAARIAEEQHQHYQNLRQLIENFPEEQLEAGLSRIVEEQQQPNLQEEQRRAGWDRIAVEQQQHYQTRPGIENLQEDQLEAGGNRIVEEQQQDYQNVWPLIGNFPQEQLEAGFSRIVEEQQQENPQEEQPGAGWDRITDEQQQLYQTLPGIENLQEEQLEGWNRIAEEQQQYCAILQQLEQRNMENLELEREKLEWQREKLELQRENFEL